MKGDDPRKEILRVACCKDFSETGGGHGQKGVDFQRYWAVMRMFELEESGANDFLLLFETIQDIAELDSLDAPASIRIYQIKKRERKEWSWGDLTGLPAPKEGQLQLFLKPGSSSKIKESLLGKLYASVIAFKELNSEGHFVSNSGCSLPLSDGSNAATSLPYNLSALSLEHLQLLAQGLGTLHEFGMPPPDLSRLRIARISLPPDDPGTYVIGLASKFLTSRSPRHAGQAQAFIESLITKISPLGARTDTCKSFEKMRQQRGFSRDEFKRALTDLEEIPDLLTYLNLWLTRLTEEGMEYMEVTGIRVSVTRIFRRQLMREKDSREAALIKDCDKWLDGNCLSGQLLFSFEKAYVELKDKHPRIKRVDLLAHLALRAIQKCVDQT